MLWKRLLISYNNLSWNQSNGFVVSGSWWTLILFKMELTNYYENHTKKPQIERIICYS